MKIKTTFVLAGCLIATGVFSQTFGGGDGTADSPYLIRTAAHFEELSLAVTAKNDFAGKCFLLDNDITFENGYTFTPAGNGLTTAFNGTFDGNGKTLRNLHLTGSRYIAMFANIGPDGVVKNLNLQNATLESTDSYGGMIAAYVKGKVENCHVQGTVTSVKGSYKGGVIGWLYTGAKATDVSFSGNITTGATFGGIVGQLYGELDHAWSDVTLISVSEEQSSHIGGLAGVVLKWDDVTARISDSYFIGNIQAGPHNICGGVAGTLERSSIERCWNGGYIYGMGAAANTGGLVGMLSGGTIRDSYNAGTVYNTDASKCGGIAGSSSAANDTPRLINCLNLGTLFNSVIARHEMCELIGGGIGDETVIENSYYDKQVTGWGSRTNGKMTEELTGASGIEGFDPQVWTFAEGLYPRLANTASVEFAVLCATPFFLAPDETHEKVKSDFTLGQGDGITWQLTESDLVSLNGNRVTVTRGTVKEDIVITAYLGDYMKRSLITVYPQLFEERGTEEDPYLISDFEDMVILSKATNEQGLDFHNEYFRMTQDIDLAYDTVNFKPISGNSVTLAFNGIFDGQGYTVRRLYIDTRTSKKMNSGLFAMVFRDGVIKNLCIAADSRFEIYRNFGSFVGILQDGTIENCRNYADVTTTDGYAGGIVGFGYGNAVIRDCYNEGTVYAGKTGNIGGIVFNNYGSTENCQNTGMIVGAGNSRTVGGIAAANFGTVNNVLNTGTVTGTAAVGGIVGVNNEGRVRNAVSVGIVAASAGKDELGSIAGTSAAGCVYEQVYYDNQITIEENLQSGISGLPTAQLIAGELAGLKEDTLWRLMADRYPVLKTFEAEKASLLASVPVVLDEKDTRVQMSGSATLGIMNGLTWQLGKNEAFGIEENRLTVTLSGETVCRDTLFAEYENYTKAIPLTALPVLFTGEGTAESPWLIRTEADLRKLSDVVADARIGYDEKYFKLTDNIRMENTPFRPIASDTVTVFGGVLDGNGKTVSNLHISKSAAYVGLFGRIGSKGKICNLTIGEESTISGITKTGAFAGTLEGTIENCVNRAAVTVTKGEAGGIAGNVSGYARLVNVRNYGDIVAEGSNQAGGIAGIASGENMVVENAFNAGAVQAAQKAAGIVGEGKGVTFKTVRNEGNITAASMYGAGIVGLLSSPAGIQVAGNSGEIKAGSKAGGIAAEISSSYSDPAIVVSEAWNTGYIEAVSNSAAGIAAKVSGEIRECVNTGAVTLVNENSTYSAGAGGIVADGKVNITDCWNAGIITGFKNVGGIMGYMSSATAITNCYSSGTVICTDTSASPVAGAVVGKKSTSNTNTNVYYDKQFNSLLGAGKEEHNTAGLTTLELTEVDLGEKWVRMENAYPVPGVFKDSAFARLYSLPVFLAATDSVDTYKNVTRNFLVGTSYGAVWTGDDVFEIDPPMVQVKDNTKGDYRLTVTADGLSRTFALHLDVPHFVSVEEVSGYRIYPVEGGILVAGVPDTPYSVYDLSGRMVLSGSTSAWQERIPVARSGVYLVKLVLPGESYVRKIVIK